MPPWNEEAGMERTTNRTCPACGSGESAFRGRKKAAEAASCRAGWVNHPFGRRDGDYSKKQRGGFMFKFQAVTLILVLAGSTLLAAPPVRKFDDPGAPPFKVLNAGENPPLEADGNL